MAREFPDPECPLSPIGISRSIDLLLDRGIGNGPKGEFLLRLHRRGESAAELAGFAAQLLERSLVPSIERAPDAPLLELCGTGGDRAGLINVSTAAMFVAAGAGARVVKHGNRAVSSRSGSADVLEALGVSVTVPPERVGTVLEKAGCAFLLAPHFHPTYSLLSPLRKELAARGEMTIFNLLGPLLNPAAPDFQLTGVFRGDLLDLYATAMGLLGRRCAWAVHGPGLRPGEGIDELSVTGPSQCVEVLSEAASQRSGSHSIALSVALRAFTLNPADLGFEAATDPLSLLGGDAAVNAERIVAILSGRERGSASDMVVLNASAALRVAGLASDLTEAKSMALESIASGAASLTLKKLIEATSQVSVP